MREMLLEIEGITKRYGGLVANNAITIHVGENETVGLIGPNGAGKSTLFKIILGIVRSDEGRICLNGKDITRKTQNEVCRAGICCTFQLEEAFNGLSALESVLVGAYCRQRGRNAAKAKALELLDLMGISGIKESPISELNTFERKKVELASALATTPKVLLLDELFAGCTKQETDELIDLIARIKMERGITVVVIEHVLQIIRKICDRVVVLDFGEVIESGVPENVYKSPKVIQAYLGENPDAIEN